MKAGYDARERARKEKEREREEREAEERREEEERDRDLNGWALKMRKEHEVRFAFRYFYYRFGVFLRVQIHAEAYLHVGHHGQNQRPKSQEGSTHRSQECRVASKNEEYCESCSRRTCSEETAKSKWRQVESFMLREL